MSNEQSDVEAFKRLAQKRKSGLLSTEEEEEYRRLGRQLAARQRARKDVVAGLRGRPLPGCDFFDDFPELYRLGVLSNDQDLPGPGGEPILPGAASCRGQIVLADGSKLAGHVLWAAEPSVDGRPVKRAAVRAVFLSHDGDVLPGSGRLLRTADGREIRGYLASDLDPEFVDLIPSEGLPKSVARVVLKRDQLSLVEPWKP